MSTKAGVYCLKNRNNGKKYIGSSKHIYSRLQEHLTQLENHIHSNKGLQEAFDKDGLEFCIIEFTNESEEILEREQYWIQYYDSINPEYGYNKVNSLTKKVSKKRKSTKNSSQYILKILETLFFKSSKLRKIIRVIKTIMKI